MNKVILVGRVGAHPEVQTFGSGNLRASFSLATRGTFKPKGKEKPDPDWHNIVAWNKTADVIQKLNVAKGSQVAIEGKLQPYSYQNKSGDTVRGVNVVVDTIELLDNPKKQGQDISQLHPHPASVPPVLPMGDDQDDLPF